MKKILVGMGLTLLGLAAFLPLACGNNSAPDAPVNPPAATRTPTATYVSTLCANGQGTPCTPIPPTSSPTMTLSPTAIPSSTDTSTPVQCVNAGGTPCTSTATPTNTPPSTFTPNPSLTPPCGLGSGLLGMDQHAASGGSNDNTLWAGKYILGQAVTLTSMAVYAVYGPSNSPQVETAIYADSAGAPGPLIVSSGIQTFFSGWNYFSVPSTVLAAGYYWLSFQASSGTGQFSRGTNTSAYLNTVVASFPFGPFPSAFPGSFSTATEDLAIYAVYCPVIPFTPTPTFTLTSTSTGTPTPTFTPTVTPTGTPTPPYGYSFSFGVPGTASGHLNNPSYISCYQPSTVLSVSTTNNQIVQYDGSGNYLAVAGTAGAGGNANGQFSTPGGAYLSEGFGSSNLWVIDTGNSRIENMQNTGTGWFYYNQWGSLGSGNGQFTLPGGIVNDGTYFYVADTYNSRVQKFDLGGVYQGQWSGSGGSTGSSLGYPSDLAVNPVNGNIVVVDFAYHRVEVFSNTGSFVRKWGKNGGDGTSGSGNGEFNTPTGLDMDSAGYVYVADQLNNRVQKFDSLGTFVLVIGAGSGSGPGQFTHPSDVAVDSAGNLYVSDTANNRIEKFSPQ